MSHPLTSAVVGDPAWTAFAGRHPGHPALAADAVYALPGPMIDAIREEAPRFFTEVDLRFERDLTRSVGFGFFLGRPLGMSEEQQRAAFERSDATRRKIKEMLAEERLKLGMDAVDVEDQAARDDANREKIVARKDAYAGWLVCDPVYRAELRQFRDLWEDAVRAAGRFPEMEKWFFPTPQEPDVFPADFRRACEVFYCRWGLDTLTTWDWPEPMEPDLNYDQRRDVALLSTGGIFVFLPWYMLRGEVVDLREVVRKARLSSPPGHLQDWVAKRPTGAGDTYGDARYGTIRWLYRCFELVLRRRYPAACRRNLGKLDLAFAGAIDRDAELVRKLRQEMARSLKATAEGQSPE